LKAFTTFHQPAPTRHAGATVRRALERNACGTRRHERRRWCPDDLDREAILEGGRKAPQTNAPSASRSITGRAANSSYFQPGRSGNTEFPSWSSLGSGSSGVPRRPLRLARGWGAPRLAPRDVGRQPLAAGRRLEQAVDSSRTGHTLQPLLRATAQSCCSSASCTIPGGISRLSASHRPSPSARTPHQCRKRTKLQPEQVAAARLEAFQSPISTTLLTSVYYLSVGSSRAPNSTGAVL
jgi:hypothetical protein